MGPRRLIRVRQLRRKTLCLAMREDEVTAPAEAQQDGRELALVVGKVVPRRWWPPRDSAARAEGHGPTVGGQGRLTRPPASPAPIPDACDPMYRRRERRPVQCSPLTEEVRRTARKILCIRRLSTPITRS